MPVGIVEARQGTLGGLRASDLLGHSDQLARRVCGLVGAGEPLHEPGSGELRDLERYGDEGGHGLLRPVQEPAEDEVLVLLALLR